MKFLLVFLLLIPVITASDEHQTKGSQEEGQKVKEAQILKETVKGNAEFAINFFKHVTSVSSHHKDSQAKNVVFSPLSISTAFSMLSLGARSETHREIWEGLSLNDTHGEEEPVHQAFSNLLQALNEPKSSLQVDIGNAIFLDDKLTLLKSFKDNAQQYYHAEITQHDFSHIKEVENEINEFVKNKTEGKIEDLIKDLSEDAKMVLVNYVLFKGEWEKTFQKDLTRAAKFFLDKDTTVDVQMMHRTGVYNTFHDTELPCTVLELPYKDGASMIIAIAEPGKIHEVEQGMSVKTLQRWKTSFQSSFIELYMPKYSICSTLDLEKELSALGIKTAFTDLADFSGITQDVGLKVGKAKHKAVLEVDEKGTEAAAVTTIEMVPTALFPTVEVNRPFISVICDHNTKSILFMATVMNPVEK